MKIIFDLDLLSDQLIELDFTDSQGATGRLKFVMPDAWNGDIDGLGAVLVTLCGSKYLEIEFNFAIDSEIKLKLESLYKVLITAPVNSSLLSKPHDSCGIALSFSGGFDSLACYALMPSATKLVSMDFGGRFAREREFFNDFSPNVVSTNLCDLGFNKNGWLFMAAGLLLMKSSLSINKVTFGNILEASRNNIKKSFQLKSTQPSVLKMFGLQVQPVALGLTEIGTAIVAGCGFPDIMHKSLISLAGPNDEKFYRKSLILKSLSDRYEFSRNIPEPNRPANSKLSFGDNFAVDFLTPYFIKNVGLDLAITLNKNIPDYILNFVASSRLDFYERFDSRFLNSLNPSVRSNVYGKFSDYGILPYEAQDYDELFELDSMLK